MGKRIVIKTPAARSNSSEGTRKGIEKKLKSLPTERKALNTLLKGNSDEKDIHAEARRATLCQTESPTESTAWCATCEQGSNEEDRDAPPGETIKVKWIKFRCDLFGRMVPNGQECYPCFDVRRKSFNRASPGVTAIDGQHINHLLEIYPVVFAGRYWSFIRSNIVVRRALALIKWVFVFR